jgi:hypothetical protein
MAVLMIMMTGAIDTMVPMMVSSCMFMLSCFEVIIQKPYLYFKWLYTVLGALHALESGEIFTSKGNNGY